MNKRKLRYPPDGGLKKQVRPVEETFSAFECIRIAYEEGKNE